MDWVIQKRDQWIQNTQACLKFSFFMFGGAIFHKWSIIYKYFLGWSYVIQYDFIFEPMLYLFYLIIHILSKILYFLVMSKYSRVSKEKKKWMSNCLIMKFSLDFFTWIDILLFELDSSPSS